MTRREKAEAVDRIGSLRSQIARLQGEEKALAAALKEGAGIGQTVAGSEYRGIFSEGHRTEINEGSLVGILGQARWAKIKEQLPVRTFLTLRTVKLEADQAARTKGAA